MHPKKPASAKVEIVKDGPYMVSGSLPLSEQTIGTNSTGESVKWIPGKAYPLQAQYALCRCGRSASKPFCDGAHSRSGFIGTETASRDTYRSQAKIFKGPAMSLTDAESLCGFARFCDPHGQVWNLVKATDDPQARKHFLRETCDCPSGRLVAWDNASGQALEPKYEPAVGLIEDPANGCSGPLWLKGSLQLIGSDGFHYEVRNRVTVCRCGASQNKPFCDGAHASIKFNAHE
jgi:CDGSH-type Zn-finger protein